MKLVTFSAPATAITEGLPEQSRQSPNPDITERLVFSLMGDGFQLGIVAHSPQELMDLADKIAIIAERWEAES